MPVVIAIVLAAAAAPDNTALAREHFQSAQLHYSLGEFEEAVKDFREAYRLKQAPAILFNIAQAYRQLHQYKDAYFYYRQYLGQKGEIANRAEVESLVEQMRLKLDEEEEQKTRIARDPAAAKNSEAILVHPDPAPPPQAAPPPSHELRVAGYVALGAGALGEGLALLMHSSAQSAADQFNQKYSAGQLTAADGKLKSDAQSKGRIATAALIGGAALLLTGAVLCFAF